MTSARDSTPMDTNRHGHHPQFCERGSGKSSLKKEGLSQNLKDEGVLAGC